MTLADALSMPVLFAIDIESLLRGLGSEFTGSRAKLGWQDGATIAGVIVAVVIVVFALTRYLRRHDRHQKSNHPGHLFLELCKTHGIDSRGRKALAKLAKFHRLEHPSRLFLEPERFDKSLNQPQLAPYAIKLTELRAMLFQDLQDAAV